jgi:hypothetical protein
MELLAGSLLASAAFAQVTGNPVEVSGSSTTTTTTAPSLQTYLQEEHSLLQQRQALVSQGATPQQLQAWRQQNATQFAALQQMAQSLSLASESQPARIIQSVNIPTNASSNLQDFLTTQASLSNAHAQIYNQLLQTLPSNPTEPQLDSIRQQASQIFRQQYAANLQSQAQQAQALAAESPAGPARIPGPVPIPPNASPQLQAYLTAENALASSRAQFLNQLATADPATRQAAIQQWRQQNAASLQQLRQLAQSLSNPTATIQETPTQ